MSRSVLRLFATGAVSLSVMAFAGAAHAQESYGPALPDEDEADGDSPLTQTRPSRQCETEEQQDGVILVCRELEDDEAYRSPLPAPTESDRVWFPGIDDPPCWVQPRNNGMVNICVRMGWAPEPAIMVDLTQYPEPLDPEVAAVVSRAPEEEGEEGRTPRTGERVPIDLSDD